MVGDYKCQFGGGLLAVPVPHVFILQRHHHGHSRCVLPLVSEALKLHITRCH
jgi:hypothetical protein